MFDNTFFNETKFRHQEEPCDPEGEAYSPWCYEMQNLNRLRIEGQSNKQKTIKRRYASEMESHGTFGISTPTKSKPNSSPHREVIKTSITISYEDPRQLSNKNPHPSPYSIKLPVLTPKKHAEDRAPSNKKITRLNDSLLRENQRTSLKKYVNYRSKHL